MYFSKSTMGFYDPSISESIPDDAVEITYSLYQDLLSNQSDSRILCVDSCGLPYLKTVEAPSLNSVNREHSWIQSELSRIRDEIEKIEDDDPNSVGTSDEWRFYRRQVRAWPTSQGFPDESKRPIFQSTTQEQA